MILESINDNKMIVNNKDVIIEGIKYSNDKKKETYYTSFYSPDYAPILYDENDYYYFHNKEIEIFILIKNKNKTINKIIEKRFDDYFLKKFECKLKFKDENYYIFGHCVEKINLLNEKNEYGEDINIPYIKLCYKLILNDTIKIINTKQFLSMLNLDKKKYLCYNKSNKYYLNIENILDLNEKIKIIILNAQIEEKINEEIYINDTPMVLTSKINEIKTIYFKNGENVINFKNKNIRFKILFEIKNYSLQRL